MGVQLVFEELFREQRSAERTGGTPEDFGTETGSNKRGDR